VVAAVLAVEDRQPFHCRLVIDGRVHDLELLHLSIINAPVFGGFLGMRLRQSRVDDRLLDVLAVENIPLRRAVRAALEALLQVRRTMSGILSFHVSRMEVHSDRPLEAALDGEVCGRLPATFAVAGAAATSTQTAAMSPVPLTKRRQGIRLRADVHTVAD